MVMVREELGPFNSGTRLRAEENNETPVRIDDNLAEIRIVYLLNKNLERYHYTNLLS
jgi:hypothetical protein